MASACYIVQEVQGVRIRGSGPTKEIARARLQAILDDPERLTKRIEQGKKYSVRRRAAKDTARRAVKSHSTVSWDQAETAEKVRDLTTQKSKFNVPMHIDHVVPMHGGRNGIHLVQGFHVHYNLSLITEEENLRKNNKYWPDMWEYDDKHLDELQEMYDAIS